MLKVDGCRVERQDELLLLAVVAGVEGEDGRRETGRSSAKLVLSYGAARSLILATFGGSETESWEYDLLRKLRLSRSFPHAWGPREDLD